MTAVPARMCARCGALTDQPVRVREVHGDAGPGWNVYAYPACAPAYPVEPDPLALLDGMRSRRREREEGR